MRNTAMIGYLNHMGQRLLVLTMAACLVVGSMSPALAARHHHRTVHRHHAPATPEPDRYSSIVIDANTGYVLSEKDADARRYPASLSKMMTLYLVFEALQNGTVTKNQRLPISANAEYQEPSKLGLKEGYTIRLEDAIYGVVTRSANDAAVVLAEGVGGSEARFARMMTFKAQQLGMRGTHFVNASGLFDPMQYSTAHDIAILAQALIRDFPREYHYFSTPSFTYAGLVSVNHNHLMQSYPGMDGLKTGYVHKSGYNLCASAVHNGRRLIGVIFGGRTANSRNQAMALLLDSGFDRLKDPRVMALLEQREKLADARAPRNGKPGTTTIYANPAAPQPPAQGRAQMPYNAVQQVQPAEGEGDVNEAPAAVNQFQPKPLNTAIISQPPVNAQGQPAQMAMLNPPPQPVAGTWAIQIGAYSSHDASMMALRNAKEQLPARLTASSRYMIVPLMTNRGMIYRARMGGMDRVQAATACRVLQGSCVVLAVQ